MAEQDGNSQSEPKQEHPSSEKDENGREQGSGSQESGRSRSEQKSQGKGSEEQGGSGEQGQQKQEPSRVEWIVGIVCALLVLSAVGYLSYRAFSGPDRPPMVTIRAERVLPIGGGGYLVEFKAVNEGSGTAANLTVEGTLMQDTVVVEKSTATVQFVPAETEREGGLVFSKDPRLYRLEVRPTGFDRP